MSKRESTIAFMDTDVRVGFYDEKEPCERRSLDHDAKPKGHKCGGKRVTMMVPKGKVQAEEVFSKYKRNEVVIYRSLMVTICEECDKVVPR